MFNINFNSSILIWRICDFFDFSQNLKKQNNKRLQYAKNGAVVIDFKTCSHPNFNDLSTFSGVLSSFSGRNTTSSEYLVTVERLKKRNFWFRIKIYTNRGVITDQPNKSTLQEEPSCFIVGLPNYWVNTYSLNDDISSIFK